LRNRNRLAAAVVVASALSLAACGGMESDTTAVSSAALDVAPCSDAIAVLKVQTDAVQYTSKQARQDEAGLLGKLGNAASKLSAGDLDAAVKQLNDYLHQLQNLIKNGEIAPSLDGAVTPDMLVAGALSAIACIKPV
jgi:hypothetical protein